MTRIRERLRGSFISVNHSIKGKGALTCSDCHKENGRLDFAALGYSAEKQETLTNLDVDHSQLITEYQGPTQCEGCHKGKTAELHQTGAL